MIDATDRGGQYGKAVFAKAQVPDRDGVLRDNRKPGQVAKAYGVHPNSVNKWTKTVLEEEPELFAKEGTVVE